MDYRKHYIMTSMTQRNSTLLLADNNLNYDKSASKHARVRKSDTTFYEVFVRTLFQHVVRFFNCLILYYIIIQLFFISVFFIAFFNVILFGFFKYYISGIYTLHRCYSVDEYTVFL